jgi:8-oxo-dGTP pyrophosphatase MutT (NUDIX family)
MKKLYKRYLESMIGDEDKVKIIMNVAAGIIFKEGENGEKLILLIQRASTDKWPDFYEYPRGKCDFGVNESLIHCCKREVKEETGLDVEVLGLIDTFEYLADEGARKSICHNFLCRMKDENQKIKLSHEHQNFTWIQSVGEAEIMLLPDQKKTIAKVFNKDTQIVNYPDNKFTQNNQIEEYLQRIQ